MTDIKQDSNKITSGLQSQQSIGSKFKNWLKGFISKSIDQTASANQENNRSYSNNMQRVPDSINNKKDGTIIKTAESNTGQNQNNLSKEEVVERSWDFLTNITEKVSSMPYDAQRKIIDIGKRMSQSGATYNHLVPGSTKHRTSPAKEAAKKALEAEHNSNNPATRSRK